MEKDTVFVPPRRSEVEGRKSKPSLLQQMTDHHAADTPIVTVCSLIFHQVFGWPAYILINAGAGVKSLTRGDRLTSGRANQLHLNPKAHVFTPGEAPLVAMSNVGILGTMAALYLASRSIGGWNTALAYGLPYLWMNHWIGEYHHFDTSNRTED
jgi:omega-6 fatty acid desaturase (delta-12 desaturase)